MRQQQRPLDSRFRLFIRRQRDGIRFCLLFAAFTVLAFAILYAAQTALVVPLNRHLAWATGGILRAFGATASSNAGVVAVGGFAVEIKNNCNAVYEIGLYTAAVWAYPASTGARLMGTLMGAAVLYLVNFIRILTLVAVGLLHPAWFQPAHLYAWQALFLLVVAACWLSWVSRIRPVG